MANGEGMWAAISEVRTQGAKHEREIGVLDSRVADLKEDVNQIGEENRKTRREVNSHVDKKVGEVNDLADLKFTALEARFDRVVTTFRWVIGLSVPAVCTLLGLLIGKS